jgi:hypothetical protein
MPAVRALRVALAGVSLVVVTAACTGPPKDKASLKGDVRAPISIGPESTEPTTSTTALSVTALVLASDGIGPLPFGMQAARAMNGLTQALGRAETITVVPADSNCGATRIFGWKDFNVLINEVTARSGGNPGLVGWSLGATAPSSGGLKTDSGIGIGSTLAAVKEAYGSAVTVVGSTFAVRGASSGVLTGELDGSADTSRVKALRAGVSCTV